MKKHQTYKGFNSWVADVKLAGEMYASILKTFFLVQLTTLVFSGAYFLAVLQEYGFDHGNPFLTIAKYTYCFFMRAILPDMEIGYALEIDNTIEQGEITVGEYFRFFTPLMLAMKVEIEEIALKTFYIYLLYPCIILYFRHRAKRQSENSHMRGAKIITVRELNKTIRRDRKRANLTLFGVTFPVSSEVEHVFSVGRPGMGKTVLLSGILEKLKSRQGCGVIYDFKGDYLSRFYNPETDIIFNPVDSRCVGWQIFNEIETTMDIDSISASLIPLAQQSEQFWNDGARDVFSGILHYLYHQDKKTNRDIWEMVSAPATDIANALSTIDGGARGLRYIEDAGSKQAMSILSVLMQYVKSFEFMQNIEGGFSINTWLEKNRGWIFVTNYPLFRDTIRPILSLFIDLLGRKLLSMQEDFDRRVYFFLDEFGTLQRLSSILNLLTLSRSKGGSVWIGIQDLGQIDKIYSSSSRQSIVNACGSSITFGVSEPDTAKLLSDQIGEQENMRTRHSVSGGLPENRDGYSYTSEQKIEKLVIPSELMDLQSLEGYLKISGYPLIKGKLAIKKYTASTRPLILRKEVFLKNIKGKKLPDRDTASPKEIMNQEQKKDYFQMDLP